VLPAIRVDPQALIGQPVPFRSSPVSQRADLENGTQEDTWRRAATR
jgi:hypothetical protein